jgi:hypothetical protein
MTDATRALVPRGSLTPQNSPDVPQDAVFISQVFSRQHRQYRRMNVLGEPLESGGVLLRRLARGHQSQVSGVAAIGVNIRQFAQ